jgi:hypothetical protein
MNEWVSDYIPSVEDMRETYRETYFYRPHTNSEKEKDAEFDRFLELVKEAERERIIKVLEGLKVDCVCEDCKPHQERNDHYLTALQDIIKGENK